MRGIWMMLGLVALLALHPCLVHAQSSDGAALLVDGNVGPILLGVGPCGQQSAPGVAAGVEVRNRGAWVVSVGLDILLPGLIRTLLENVGCVGTQAVTTYGGEQAYVTGGGSSFPLVRMGFGFGRAFPDLPLGPVLSLGAGFIPANTYFGTTVAEPRVDRTDFSLEPWFAGRLHIQPESFPVGLRLEVGKHRLRRRLYAQDEDRLLAEIHHWSWALGAAVVVPLRR